MTQLLKTIAAISDTHNPSLKILVLTTMFDRRQNLDRLIRRVLAASLRDSRVSDLIRSGSRREGGARRRANEKERVTHTCIPDSF